MSHVDRPKHWTTLAEAEGAPSVEALKGREFFASPEDPVTMPSRRDFLKLMGAGAAFLAAGCARKPVEKILPYVHAPEEVTPGNAVYYASTCQECPAACGILIKTREGRPIKLEGNPDHPLNRGGLCSRGQASVLNLYDPDRLRGPALVDRRSGKAAASTWGAVDKRVLVPLKEIAGGNGKMVLLTGTLTSPTTASLTRAFLDVFPSAEHVVYDAISADATARAQELSYGDRLVPRYRLDRADVLVTLGADPLGTFLSPVEFARDFAARRKPEAGSMSRVIAFEPIMTLTGTNADRRVLVKAEHLYPVAMALANEILVRDPRSPLAGDAAAVAAVKPFGADKVEADAGLEPGTIGAVADELWQARGRGLVMAGPQAAPAAHAVPLQLAVNLLNSALGNEGMTVDGRNPSLQSMGSEEAMLGLVERMRAGDVKLLVVYGTNPAYSLPSAVNFADAAKRVGMIVSLSDRLDETARLGDAVAPATHFLESWDDHEPRPGVLSLTQPAIAPLCDARSFHDTLLAWARYVGKGPLAETAGSYHEYLRERWRTEVYPKANAAGPFDLFWEGALRTGVLAPAGDGTVSPRTFRSGSLAALPAADATVGSEDLSLVLYAPVNLYDGRSANNAWLQELPDPVSKVCWDNYVALAPARAKKMGLHQSEDSPDMGSDIVTVDVGHTTFDLPVMIQPGLHPDVAAIALGYGRSAAGRVGDRVGVSAFQLAEATGGRVGLAGIRARISRSGRRGRLACVQSHNHTEGRPIIYETTLAEYLRDPKSGNEGGEAPITMWSHHPFPVHKWGMAIDLNACIGCNACMIACQAENNLPVVGKDLVIQGREMAWIRIDRYYSGEPDAPDSTYQPMLCQQCENAPCETVCPVLATTHSSEGLNMQIYNRCVGTRYCSNNCPYKVRRFNWFDYSHVQEKSLRLVLNPDVTVRSKGVMEKCTFCVQRIRDGKEHAKALG
ncbi:MAG: TAT-variant-translocated molybdopterin oxidoreductase, partial [Hyphomicrobiales bacterium]